MVFYVCPHLLFQPVFLQILSEKSKAPPLPTHTHTHTHTHTLKIQANICQTDTGETQEIGLHPQQNKSFTTLGIPFLSYGASQMVQW